MEPPLTDASHGWLDQPAGAPEQFPEDVLRLCRNELHRLSYPEGVSVVDSAVAKIARGRQHIEKLTREIDNFLSTEPYAVERRVVQHGREHLYVVSRDESAPTSIGLLIGDAAHNLRSALDYLVVSCAIRSVGRALTEKEERGLQYPICCSSRDFEKKRKNKADPLNLLHPVLLEIIRRYQPYMHRPNNPKQAHSYYLAQLDNIDKHRRSATTSYVVSIPLEGEAFVAGGPIPRVVLPEAKEWGVGAVVVRLLFPEPSSADIAVWKPKFSITIDDEWPSAGRPDKILDQCAQWIEHFIVQQVVWWESGALTSAAWSAP